MATSEDYRRQVALLIRVLPFVAEEQVFALKGGTAINFFIRDLPRLSVDIDLTYLPVAARPESLADIDAAMKRIAGRVTEGLPGTRVQEAVLNDEGTVNKLFVREGNLQALQVKIEVTPVARGCVYVPERRTVSARVEEEFGFAENQIVSFPDLYAGKIVAALDRQHPRDLFDVRDLFANEGIDEVLRTAFVVYMLSHNRPMEEVLAPTLKDITKDFERDFSGMTENPVTLDNLVEAREQLVTEIVGNMPRSHKDLLVSFVAGELDWSLIDVPHAPDLPAVSWRQQNLDQLDGERRKVLVDALKAALA